MIRDHSVPYAMTAGLGISGGVTSIPTPNPPQGEYICGSDLPDEIQSTGMFADDTPVLIFTTIKELYRYAPSCLPSIEHTWPTAALVNIATMIRRL